MFHKISPILPAINMQTTALFYKEKLNFDISYFGNYLVLSKENIELFFYEEKDVFLPLSCFIFVSNVEDMYSKFSSMGMIGLDGKLKIKPGNLKEFEILDNNGHRLRFGEKG